jgi:hypothetical protein
MTNTTSFSTRNQEIISPSSSNKAYSIGLQGYGHIGGSHRKIQHLVESSRIMANMPSISSSTQGNKIVTGKYSPEERALKIKYFKDKKLKWRTSHPVSRVFAGRRRVAQQKFRVKGKFVKSSSSLNEGSQE